MQVMKYVFALMQFMWHEANEALEMAVHRHAMELMEDWDQEKRHDRLQHTADIYDAIGMRQIATWCRNKLAK